MIIIVGHEGQDGSILTRRLRAEDDITTLVGISRHTISDLRTGMVKAVLDGPDTIIDFIFENKARITKIFYFAAHHRSSQSIRDVQSHFEGYFVNTTLPLKIAGIFDKSDMRPRFIYPSSCLIYEGYTDSLLVDENTTPTPRSEYSLAKCMTTQALQHIHESGAIDFSACILFAHESFRRPSNFLSTKVARGVVDIYMGHSDHISLGAPHALLNWGHATHYVDAMVDISNVSDVGNFVIGSDALISVSEYVEACYQFLGMTSDPIIRQDSTISLRLVTPHRTQMSKFEQLFGWRPRFNLSDFVDEMLRHNLKVDYV